WARDDQGARVTLDEDLLPSETALHRLGLSASFPEITALRRVLAQWRFFHAFRTDAASILRRPCPAVTSPTLQSDGGNLAAVFATLRHIRGDTADLDQAINDAFPGAELVVPPPQQHASLALRYPEFPQREFGAHELSDGTLQYLALMGALMSYRLPPFLALNEPETSLHPSLLAPLGRLIAGAAMRTQILVVTHSEALAAAINEHSGISTRRVIKNEGATWIEGLSKIGTFTDA
ncbi:MAG: AAA family ATPase, partial [Novosphingobium sp.]